MGRIIIGTERIRCPKCGRINIFDIHTDLPERDRRACGACGYSAVINFIPILDKYGIPHGASLQEKRDMTKYLRKETNKI